MTSTIRLIYEMRRKEEEDHMHIDKPGTNDGSRTRHDRIDSAVTNPVVFVRIMTTLAGLDTCTTGPFGQRPTLELQGYHWVVWQDSNPHR